MLKKIALGVILGLSTLAASAQAASAVMATEGSSAYVQDARGVVIRSADGLCWRTGYWTPADAVRGCDGELVPPIVSPAAPKIVPPAPLAEASPPAPALAPSSVAKRCDFSVTFKADETFAFNKAGLSEAAKKRIDTDVVDRLGNCAKIGIILITGHTDRLGSHRYNQKLSEKRADAVARQLATQGVTANIETLGAGKTQALQACSEKSRRAQLLECLASDRRVVIEVQGIAK